MGYIVTSEITAAQELVLAVLAPCIRSVFSFAMIAGSYSAIS